MASSSLAFGSLLVVFGVIFAAVSGDGHGEVVVTLDHSNFTDYILNSDFVLVEFYAPWCGGCTAYAPKYEEAATLLQNHDPPIVLAKLDVADENNKEIATKFAIKKYPTLKIFAKGGKVLLDLRGPKQPEELVPYLKKHRGPASTEIKSPEDATNLIDANKIVLIGVFPDFSGKEFENFITLAENLRIDYEFGHTSDAKFLPRGDSSVTGPLVRLFKPFDELFADTQDFDLQALGNFIDVRSTPTVTPYDKDPGNMLFITKFVRSPGSKAMLFADFSSEGIDTLKSKYQELAQQHKGEGIVFLFGDAEISEGFFKAFGVKEDQLPVLLIHDESENKYLKTHVKPDHLASVLEAFKDGKLPLHLKSEPIPEANDEPLKVVVGDTIQDMVLKSEKNVLLAFYVPWDADYKNFAPILDAVAIEYQSVPDVVISKIHAAENDYPKEIFEVKKSGVLFFKRASGKMVKYGGKLTKEAILDFIESHRDKVAEQAPAKDKAAEQESVKDEL